MLLVPTYLADSTIHGLGVFAGRDIAAGEQLWVFDPRVDLLIPEACLPGLPESMQRYLETYGYRDPAFPGRLVYAADNAKYLNHSDDANADNSTPRSVARRPIRRGEEITCDYRELEGAVVFAERFYARDDGAP
jgi:SET domain-containing protein